ncbi:MAG: type II secretion system protein GspL [Gammaproteobacteria bacterium]
MTNENYWWIYAQATTVEWIERRAGVSEPLQQGSCADISDVPAPEGSSLVVCIPGEHVRIHNVIAPARNRRRFFDSLGYALEDKLLHAPEDYHFVPLTKSKSLTNIPVAVISKNYLEGLLNNFKIRGWRVECLLPDYFCINDPSKGNWIVDVTEEPFLLRFPGDEGGAAITGMLGSHLPGPLLLALERADEKPQQIHVRLNDDLQKQNVENWSVELEKLSVNLLVIEDNQSRSNWLSKSVSTESNFNLLTGPYASTDNAKDKLRRFIPMTGLAAAVLLTIIAQWMIEGSQIKSEYTEIKSSIEQRYKEVFPTARNLIDPRFQMESQLQKYRDSQTSSDGAGTNFLGNLVILSNILDPDNNQLQKLEYDGKQFILEVSVTDYEALEKLQKELEKTMNITVDNADLREGRVYSRLSLESKT